MKAIMYHYVRQFNPGLPNFRFLDVKNFQKQLDFFQEQFGFVSKDEWLNVLKSKKLESAKGKVLLTFDDAMSCHYEYVYKVLKKRGLWGIFYVPTQPYQKGKVLDVHRIHFLCGAFDGSELLTTLEMFLDKSMIPDGKRKEFREQTYIGQDNYEGISKFKRILNYFVSYEYREGLIDSVAHKLNYLFETSDFYVPVDKLKKMQLSGNMIGSHTVSHPVMSKLSKLEQNAEINDSFGYLSMNIKLDFKTYCHPYGGFHSFNEETVKALEESGVEFSFNVESRDICDDDLASSIQFLPRYDCNEFPFGKAS
jgi:peptidoglycan/xylan/chitin deacetylase (PgdA/CDA1 family)